MKNLFYLFLISCIGLATFFTLSCQQQSQNTPVVNEKKDSIQKIKIVFIITNKDIDFNQMAINEVIDKIENDTLEVKALSPELYLKPQIIKVYKVEDITCPYLKERFVKDIPGQLVYEYNGTVLVKLKDGVIRVYHSHLEKK